MKKLFNEKLSVREFGSDVIRVTALMKWAENKGLLIPFEVNGFDVVQVEALLCEIERNAYSQSHEHAATKIAKNLELKQHKLAAIAPVWLAGADAHLQWRDLLSKAIATGEIALLDCDSFLPVTPLDSSAAQIKTALSIQVISNDELACTLAELTNNGEPIDWRMWQSMKNITPEQAAKLVFCIDPIKWKGEKYAQKIIPDELRIKIENCAQYLAGENQEWTIPGIVQAIGADGVPYSMKHALEDESQAPSAPKSEAVTVTSHSSNEPYALESLEAFRSMKPCLFGDELSITFIGAKPEHDDKTGLGANNMLKISARGTTKTVAIASLDLVNKQYGGVNGEGAVLIGFMQGRVPQINEKNATKISRLRAIFKTHLGIISSPFHAKKLGWKPRFKIEDKCGAGYERQKRECEVFKTVSLDEMAEHGEKARGANQAQQYSDDYPFGDENDAAAEFLSGNNE